MANLLGAEPDLRVEQQVSTEVPDVVVVNLTHSDEAESFRRLYPGSRILARVSPLRPNLRKADVDGWVDTVAPHDVLVDAIRRLAGR